MTIKHHQFFVISFLVTSLRPIDLPVSIAFIGGVYAGIMV